MSWSEFVVLAGAAGSLWTDLLFTVAFLHVQPPLMRPDSRSSRYSIRGGRRPWNRWKTGLEDIGWPDKIGAIFIGLVGSFLVYGLLLLLGSMMWVLYRHWTM